MPSVKGGGRPVGERIPPACIHDPSSFAAVWGPRSESNMPRDVTRQLTPETLGRGVYDPHEFKAYSNEGPMVVRMYAEDPDASLVVLEP